MARFGQGATEYLVLLAVVLIVALVSVALLGFFPGMASDAQITQSQAYWQGASPISIVESAARARNDNGETAIYLRIKNAGTYPIRVTGVVGADGGKATAFTVYTESCGAPVGTANISNYLYLAPGEEKYFSTSWIFGTACDWRLTAITTGSSSNYVGGASSLCQNSTSSPGILDYKSLGFEYIVYIEGQQVTKRQIGKDLIVKCMPRVG